MAQFWASPVPGWVKPSWPSKVLSPTLPAWRGRKGWTRVFLILKKIAGEKIGMEKFGGLGQNSTQIYGRQWNVCKNCQKSKSWALFWMDQSPNPREGQETLIARRYTPIPWYQFDAAIPKRLKTTSLQRTSSERRQEQTQLSATCRISAFALHCIF